MFYLKKWLALEPDNVQALLWRGQVRDMVRDRQQARADYRRVVELAPDNALARLCLASILVEASEPQQALAHFLRLREQDPDNPTILLGEAECRLALGQFEEVRKILSPLMVAFPREVHGLFLMGKLELDTLHPEKAEPWLRKAVEVAPFERKPIYHLALCLKQLKKGREAKDCFARLAEVDAATSKVTKLILRSAAEPSNLDLRCEIGSIFLRHRAEPEGLRWLKSVLREVPGHRRAQKVLADYYQSIGKFDLAEQHQRLAQGGGN
jgi:predicted Zn-dependent protease